MALTVLAGVLVIFGSGGHYLSTPSSASTSPICSALVSVLNGCQLRQVVC